MPDTPLDPEERAAIVAAYRQRMAEWRPRDLQPYGCLSVIAAVLIFFGVPQLHKWGLPMPGWLGGVALTVAVLAGVGGFLVMQIRVVQESPSQRAAQAIAALAAHPGPDPAARRGEAVALLFHAYDFRGPTVSSTFDAAAAKAQLGEALAYVQAVEQVLEDAKLMSYPVFVEPARSG